MGLAWSDCTDPKIAALTKEIDEIQVKMSTLGNGVERYNLHAKQTILVEQRRGLFDALPRAAKGWLE